MRRTIVAVGALFALVASAGCASKVKEQNATLRAEVVDLRQRNADLEGQFAKAQSDVDAASASLEKKQQDLDEAMKTGTANAQASAAALQRMAFLENQLAEERNRLAAAQERLVQLSKPQADAPKAMVADASLAAFKRDLESQLARFHVTGVDVDVRQSQDGQNRVAVVLQNSFRAGSASLSYNAAATKAVVGLGKLIAERYPGSRVVVEGHTDSDPIKASKAKWDSNDTLSLARADEVKKILRQSGVADRQVSAVGMGARQPVSRGTTDRAKAQNRRVEIYIYPTQG